MTTSGSTSFSVTRDQIITDALVELGVLFDGEVPTSSMVDSANRKLNMMIKNWMSRDVGLWLNTFVTLPLVVGQQSYTIGPLGDLAIPKPLDIIEARFKSPNSDELDMFPISRTDYTSLVIKNSQGTPTQYYYDSQRDTGVLYIWQTAALSGSNIKMTVKTPVQDFVTATDTPDFPQEWYEPLMWNLAAKLMPGYKVQPNVAQLVLGYAKDSFEAAEDFDREHTSVQFVPDMRGRR